MRRRLTLLIALSLAGCARDPARDRLGTGTEVVAYIDPAWKYPSRDTVYVLPPGEVFVNLPVGTKLRVVDDSRGEPTDEYRKVKVNVLEGQYSGRELDLSRRELREAKYIRARSGPAETLQPGRTIIVRDRMRIYYEESLFRTLAEVEKSGSKASVNFGDKPPPLSAFGLLFVGSALRVLSVVDGGVKVIVEKAASHEGHSPGTEASPGMIGWVLDSDIHDNDQPKNG